MLHWTEASLLERQRTQEAERYVQQGLILRKQHVGRGHLETSAGLDRVTWWWELQGKYMQAELLVRILAVFENIRVLPQAMKWPLKVLHHLGIAHTSG